MPDGTDGEERDVDRTDAKHLDELLSNVRSEIEALDIDDDEARQRLEKLIRDVEKTIENPKHAGADKPLGDQLKASILNFELSHPRLATVMNEVMEQLGKMGI